MVGRLADGVSGEAAARELDVLMGRLRAEHPTVYPGAGAVVERLAERVTRNTRTIFVVTMAAVALLLLIAIANVVNLQLARAARRDEEFAVRAPLGARRDRIARQLLAEGLVIAGAGGALGVIAALALLPTIVAALPATLPHRTRLALVVSEVALAMMLLVGATLLGRSLARLLDVDLGFDPSNLVTMEVQASGPAYASNEPIFANHDAIRAAVRAVPGVVEVGLVSQLPLGGSYDRYGVRESHLPDGEGADADRYAVSWDYMRAMRIAVRHGRAFTEAEARDAASRVAMVSESLARRMWPAGDGVGKRIRIGGGDRPHFEVVGVAADSRHSGLDEIESQQVYTPERHWHWPEGVMVLVSRVERDAASAAPAIQAAVRSVDPLQPVMRIATMDQLVARSTAQRRLGLVLLTSFGGLALLLAATGIYGVLAGLVATRTREMSGVDPAMALRGD